MALAMKVEEIALEQQDQVCQFWDTQPLGLERSWQARISTVHGVKRRNTLEA